VLLHRRHPHADVIAGIVAALSTGVASADVVAVEVRRIAQDRTTTTDTPEAPPRRVVSLTQRRLADPEATIAALPPDRRPPPTVSAYDDLLTRRSAPHRVGATSSEVL
jgi:hypothetical protein